MDVRMRGGLFWGFLVRRGKLGSKRDGCSVAKDWGGPLNWPVWAKMTGCDRFQVLTESLCSDRE